MLHLLDTKLAKMCHFSGLTVIARPFARALVVPLAYGRRRRAFSVVVLLVACGAGTLNKMLLPDCPLKAACLLVDERVRSRRNKGTADEVWEVFLVGHLTPNRSSRLARNFPTIGFAAAATT